MSLAGKHILITRPAHQCAAIQKMLQDEGAHPTLFPLLEIKAIQPAETLILDDIDWLIFISPNAVEFGIPHLDASDFSQKTIAAIGKKTAKKLSEYQIKVDLIPRNGFNTESFLQLPETHDIQGRRIAIFRGQGGRELLATSLKKRGAVVNYIEVYQRACPTQSAKPIEHQWQQQKLDIIVITSTESLGNLYSIAKDDWIRQVPLLLGSPRTKLAARELGHQGRIIMAENPSDEAVLARLRKL